MLGKTWISGFTEKKARNHSSFTTLCKEDATTQLYCQNISAPKERLKFKWPLHFHSHPFKVNFLESMCWASLDAQAPGRKATERFGRFTWMNTRYCKGEGASNKPSSILSYPLCWSSFCHCKSCPPSSLTPPPTANSEWNKDYSEKHLLVIKRSQSFGRYSLQAHPRGVMKWSIPSELLFQYDFHSQHIHCVGQ